MASIYEIDQRIQECVDFETGEIIDAEQLDALQIERAVKIEAIACWIKNLKSDAADIKAERDTLDARYKAKEKKAQQLQDYLSSVLDNSPFESAKCKVTFRKSTKVNITDESLLPDEYKITKSEVVVDKKALGDALKLGELIDGAELSTNYNIQIK